MRTIGIVSMKGGVGRTTVAANLGAELARTGRAEVLLVDLDPRNQLGLHLGMSPEEVAGVSQAILDEPSRSRALHRGSDPLRWAPFGQPRERERLEVEERLVRQPELLRACLAGWSAPGEAISVLDSAAGPSGSLTALVELSDLLLVVLQADASSFATIPFLEEQLHPRRTRSDEGLSAHLLLNGVDEASRIGRDVRIALEQLQGRWAPLPFVIHHDEAVREAAALQRPVVEQAPGSQAAADFRTLAAWALEQLMGRRVADLGASPLTQAVVAAPGT